jgi:hypothetical protein
VRLAARSWRFLWIEVAEIRAVLSSQLGVVKRIVVGVVVAPPVRLVNPQRCCLASAQKLQRIRQAKRLKWGMIFPRWSRFTRNHR